MENNNLNEAGEQIKRIVQNAVESGNFAQLSNSIVEVVNDAVDGLQDTIKSINAEGRYQYSGQEAAERIRRELDEKRKQAAEKVKELQEEAKLPSTVGANVMQILGAVLMFIFGIPAALCVFIGIFTMDLEMLIALIIFGPPTWLGYFLWRKGGKQKKLLQHFKRFRNILGKRKFCKLSEFGSAVGIRSNEKVAEELHYMLNKSWWKEGYIDNENTWFMADHETYCQYREATEGFEMSKAQAMKQNKKSAKAADAETTASQEAASSHDMSQLPPKCQEIIREGQKYIRHIHECNDRIPGEEISEKLYRLEHTVTRIFDEVEKNPSAADDLKKLMSYYLPTTSKLLDAYCELEQQQVSGKNIDSTKQEIEAALDTINTAFENLLDSLFETQAWDISSDISVLNTMLAQEGLTGSAFEQR